MALEWSSGKCCPRGSVTAGWWCIPAVKLLDHLSVTTEDLVLDWIASITVFTRSVGDPAVLVWSWQGVGIHSLSGGWRSYHCRLFSHAVRGEGAGLRADMSPLCPGLAAPPGACASLLAGCSSSRLAWRKRRHFAEKNEFFFPITCLIHHMRPDTIVHAPLKKLQEAAGDRAGSWRSRPCCTWHGSQPVVQLVPSGGAAFPLNTTPILDDYLKGRERWVEGCMLTGSIGRSATYKHWLLTENWKNSRVPHKTF
jgi:hypothetical protein